MVNARSIATTLGGIAVLSLLVSQSVACSQPFSIRNPLTPDAANSDPARSGLASPDGLTAANPTADLSNLEQSILEQINQYRVSQSLPPLTLDPDISQQARLHSQFMSQQRSISHDGFEQRISSLSQAVPFISAAENVAYNQGYSTPVDQAVQGWLDSPGHYQNIVGNFDLTGIGVVQNAQGEYYFTQIFILKR